MRAVPKTFKKTFFLVIFLLLLLASLQLNAFVYSEPRRRASPENMSFYETDFWNVSKAINDPLNITQLSSKIETYNNYRVNVTDILFFSEKYNNIDIYIFGEILIPLDMELPLPGVLIIHGYGGTHNSFVDFALEIVKEGYVAILIDAPGGGQSTKYPSRDPASVVNTTRGPQDSYFYHVAWAGLRAISVLEQLDEVDKNRIAVTGGSMGGIMSFIIGAIDPRVKATIPIVAGGNLFDLLLSGTLADALTTPELSLNSTNVINFVKYFDVYAYASELQIPVLMLSSTNDEYFTLICLNDTFSIISSEKWWFLAPNWHHFSAYPGWIASGIKFLNYVFKGGAPLPTIEYNTITPSFDNVKVTINGSVDGNYTLYWRTGLTGDTWKSAVMEQDTSQQYSSQIVPYLSGKITFYIALNLDNQTIVTTYPKCVFLSGSYGMYLLILLLFSFVSLVLYHSFSLTKLEIVREVVSTRNYKENLANIGGLLASYGGFWYHWIGFVNKTSLSYFELIERYGNFFKINPWGALIPAIIFGVGISGYILTKNRLFTYISTGLLSLVTVFLITLFVIVAVNILLIVPDIGGIVAIVTLIVLLVYFKLQRKLR
ncbi:MAG: alpha/beta fold hydrolase, partial [Candidatus Odinarchaeota archaeon]|nr:alpha/beta fold hydrolase [Candidatus Odinarchaeota archaeon]